MLSYFSTCFNVKIGIYLLEIPGVEEILIVSIGNPNNPQSTPIYRYTYAENNAIGKYRNDNKERGLTSLYNNFNSVLFPAPLGPTKATLESRSIPNSRFL